MLTFSSSSALLLSVFLPSTMFFPTSKDRNIHQRIVGGHDDRWILSWEWRTRDADVSSLWYVFFYILIFITGTVTTIDSNSNSTHTINSTTTSTRQQQQPPQPQQVQQQQQLPLQPPQEEQQQQLPPQPPQPPQEQQEDSRRRCVSSPFVHFFFLSFLTNFSYSCVTSAGTITTAAATPAAGQQEGLETQHVSSQR